jgi:putative transposase
MNRTPVKHHRRSIRLKDYDYSQDGAYFVTICVHNRESLFGKIANEKMILNDVGKIAEQCWCEIPQHYPNVILDKYIVMPNHVHGILIIDNPSVGANNLRPYHAKSISTLSS